MKKGTIITGGVIIMIGIFLEIFKIINDVFINYGIITAGFLLILLGYFIKTKECSSEVQEKSFKDDAKEKSFLF